MNTLPELLDFTVSTLQKSTLVVNVRVLETFQFSESQFAFKVRSELVSGNVLQVRLYRNGEHNDYAFQLFRDDAPLIRWDNKEHFPDIPTHPHHFHNADGKVESSSMIGEPSHDLPIVLDHIASHVTRSSD